MNFNDNKFFNSTDIHISSRMNEYLKKNFGYAVEGDFGTLEEAKNSLQAEQVELKKQSYMSKKYMENMLMIETITSLLKAHGEDTSSSYEQQEVTEEKAEFSDKQIKMAFGILNDPRYKDGNYSGAVATIEKIAKGLSNHPSVANALKRANESVVEDFKETLEALDLNLSQNGETTTSDASPETEQVAEEIHNIDLLRKVARQMEEDAHKGDYTAIEELLQDVTEEEMKAFLSDHRSEDWSESKEQVAEDDEEEKGPDHYRWKNDSQLAVVIGRIEGAIDELDNAIQYRGENSAKFFNNGDKAGVGGLMGIKQKLEDIHSEWDKNTEYYGM